MTARTELQTDSLSKGIGFMAIANISQRAIGFLRNFAFCYLLSKNDVGLWALASSFFVIAAPVSVLGLPGCFGRYVETFRQRGQLLGFTQRSIAIATAGLILVSSCLLLFSSHSSLLIFGQVIEPWQMLVVTLTLISVVLFNTIMELLNGLRQPTAVSQMQLVSSLGFSLLSLPIAAVYPNWLSVVGAFGISMIVGAVPGIYRLKNRCRQAFQDSEPLAPRWLMHRVLPFAVTVWITDLFTNLFDVVDRYMILHMATENADLNQSLVGQFHTARILPVLFISLASMVTGLLLPYWSSDWETNDRRKVSRNYGIAIKLNVIFFWLASIAALVASPILFHTMLDGRYPVSEACLPVALLHCLMATIVLYQSAMCRCVELNRASVLIMIVSFVINVFGNFLLVPRFGVHGAMYATLGATIVMISLQHMALQLRGVKLGRDVLLFFIVPFSLLMPVYASCALLVTMVLLLGRTDLLIDEEERRSLDRVILPMFQRLGFRLNSLWPVSVHEIV